MDTNESVSYEFDNCPNTVGKCIIRTDKHYNSEIVLVMGDKEHTILRADRDQWGVWITVGDLTIAQEDGTRSFIDSLIKCLTTIKEQNEFENLESTIIPKGQTNKI